MSAPREKELKYRIPDFESYSRLIRAKDLGVVGPPFSQENHYFDSHDLRLLRARAMFRLRRTDRLVLGFKLGGETRETAGYFDFLEVEEAVPPETLDAALASPSTLLESSYAPALAVLKRFGRVALDYLGCLLNERRCIEGPYRLEIDRMQFSDGAESYQVEIETDDPEGASRWVDAEMRDRGIAATPHHKTKLEEFLEHRSARP